MRRLTFENERRLEDQHGHREAQSDIVQTTLLVPPSPDETSNKHDIGQGW